MVTLYYLSLEYLRNNYFILKDTSWIGLIPSQKNLHDILCFLVWRLLSQIFLLKMVYCF